MLIVWSALAGACGAALVLFARGLYLDHARINALWELATRQAQMQAQAQAQAAPSMPPPQP